MGIKYDDKGAIKRPDTKVAIDKAMLMNYAACAKSVRYFAENYYYIVHPVSGSQLIQLREYQLRILDAFQGNRFTILLSARQIGKTTCMAIYLLWYACFNKDKTIAILANKADTAKSILSEIKYAYEKLPMWLKPGVVEYNAFNVKFDNGCQFLAKATSPDALRGESVSLLACDEFGFVPANIADDFWNANYPTLSTGGSAIIVSTPNGTANLYYKLWKDALNSKNTFHPVKVDWHEVPGRDEKWKDETIKNIGLIRFNQEYGNQFLGSSVTLIDADYIVKKLKWQDPELKPDDYTQMWQQVKPHHKYIVSIDTAGGVGSDYSIMNVFDITEYPNKPAKQVAMWRCNTKTPPTFAELVLDSAKYWNNAYVIGEINGLSNEVLNRLVVDNEYENVYFDYDDDTYGIYSDRTSKKKACMLFKEELENGRIEIFDSDTITELGYFEEVSPGVYKAKSGRNFHDDCVVTCIWLAWFLKSRYFEDERDTWGKIISREYDSDTPSYLKTSVEETLESEDALEAFLQQDKEEHDDWLNKEEWR